MGTRLELDALLRTIAPHTYYIAPSDDRMEYPAIMYFLDDEAREFANNATYRLTEGYQLTIMDRNPDSEVRKKFLALRLPCRFSRTFQTQGICHFVYFLNY